MFPDAGVTKDEIFGQFYAALDKNNYFASAPGGDEDPAKLAKATELFEEAIIVYLAFPSQKLCSLLGSNLFYFHFRTWKDRVLKKSARTAWLHHLKC